MKRLPPNGCTCCFMSPQDITFQQQEVKARYGHYVGEIATLADRKVWVRCPEPCGVWMKKTQPQSPAPRSGDNHKPGKIERCEECRAVRHGTPRAPKGGLHNFDDDPGPWQENAIRAMEDA